ncbi:MAG: hypothetical protein JZU47_20560 [Prolixibacteraceae bacterium]|nr:hypothetical protein [Prolixibacteraceae bacterium]
MRIKYAIILALVAIAIGASVGLKMFFKPHADISKLKSEFKLDASNLITEFGQDENTATTKYSEKILEISGKLVAKNKLPNGTDLLVLEDEMQGISCQLDSSWASANQSVIQSLETGNPVTVKGVCKGYLMEIKVSPAIVLK